MEASAMFIELKTIIAFLGIFVTLEIALIGGAFGVIRSLVAKLWAQMEARFNHLEEMLQKDREHNESAHKELWIEINRLKQAHAKQHGEILDE